MSEDWCTCTRMRPTGWNKDGCPVHDRRREPDVPLAPQPYEQKRAYVVTIPGYQGGSVVEATSASKARYLAWLQISDVVPVRLIDLRVHRHREESS